MICDSACPVKIQASGKLFAQLLSSTHLKSQIYWPHRRNIACCRPKINHDLFLELFPINILLCYSRSSLLPGKLYPLTPKFWPQYSIVPYALDKEELFRFSQLQPYMGRTELIFKEFTSLQQQSLRTDNRTLSRFWTDPKSHKSRLGTWMVLCKTQKSKSSRET